MSLRDQWLAEGVARNVRILDTFFASACPCRFPRFVYWVTKDHGRGTDPLQNLLIVTCRNYGDPDLIAAVDRDDYGGGGWTCPRCSTEWLDICYERSNLNYEHRFQLRDGEAPEPFVAQDVPTVVPVFSHARRADEWEAFLLAGVPK